MSTNISKEKREKLISEIKAIRDYISAAPQDKNTGNLLTYLSEIEKDIKGKKYGLVFEEHREGIDDLLTYHTPVFSENADLFIDNGGQMNFLIEGDNLASLHLLQKTHKGKIDLIYIDPPYNTSNSFIYDDHIVGDEDDYKHSKWASFIEKRLEISKKLLSPKGFIFISIDDKEMSVMRFLCDKVFGETRFLTTIGWEKRTKCQNTKTARKMLQPKIEYILCYRNFDTRAEFRCHVIGEKSYPFEDEKGKYRIEEIGQMGASGIRGRGSMIFPILGIHPKEGNQWKIGLETVNEFINRQDLFEKNRKVYRKIRPFDEASDNIKPFWGFFGAEQYGTAESAKSELSDILENKNHGFETVKPSILIEELIFQATHSNSIILDFFAGSGTTGHSVLAANKDYGGNRKFILCTNNENNICRDITYERIKRVIDKEGYNASLKYYKVDYIPISDKLYYEYADELLKHIKELVELENGINFSGNNEIVILLTEDEVSAFLSDEIKLKSCKKIYLGHDVLLDGNQEYILDQNKIELNIIPEYYYKELEA